jgi:N-sulfoglucosamine sulfohydrolase
MNNYPIRSVRSKRWKYIRNLSPASKFHSHIDHGQGADGRNYWDSWLRKAEVDEKATAIVQRYHHRPSEELYDVSSDPHELQNLAGQAAHSETLATLRAELDRWMSEQGDAGLATERSRRPTQRGS